MSEIKDIEEAFMEDIERMSENRANAQDDIAFARHGEQWPHEVRQSREREGRPCLTINRQQSFIRQVVNDSRQNKPQIKVKPVDDNADPETAEVLSGLIRNIEYTSNADVAYDTAIDNSTTCGFGFFRICTEYSGEDEFSQDILIKRITNPLSVVFDSYSESMDGSDWKRCFVIDWMRKDEAKHKYNAKESELKSFADELADGSDAGENSVRIAEYWEVKETPSKVLLLNDGTVITEEEFLKPHPEAGIPIKDLFEMQGVGVHKERKSTKRKVIQRIVGHDILEENEWAGIYIPVVPVFGDEYFYQGKRYFKSLIRDAKDAQRMFNYWRTASTELVALAPKAPFIGPVGAFTTDASKWKTANVKSHPFIEFDPVEGGAPQRQGFTGPPAGAIQEALNAADDMKAILGIYDASLGARSNETSGRAILARQREGDVSTFHFIDNLSKSIAHAGRILVDLIPKVYDQPRVVRILGLDGSSENKTVNEPFTDKDGVERMYDLKTGKYDVAVDTGPSFTTRREEAANQMIELLRAFPQAAPFIGDLLAKNLDWPGADEIQKRLQAMLPPQIKAAEGEKDPAALEAQVKQLTAQLQQGMALFQKLQAEHEAMKTTHDIDMKKLEIDAYNAETNRMKVQLQTADTVTDVMKKAHEMNQPEPVFNGQFIDNIPQ